MLAIILVTNLYKTLAEGYGGYDMSDLLTLGWGLVGMMIVVSIIINLASKSPNQQEV